MELRQLKNFAVIVESGSFSKAAERLHITQPSLSQQIINLESELGTALLVRSSQGVQPTVAGQILHRHARQMIRQAEDIRSDVASAAVGLAGTVAVGLPTTIAAVLTVPLFERVGELYPGVRLQIFESMSGYVSEMLANGRLDLAVLFRAEDTRGSAAQYLFDEQLFLLGETPELSDLGAECPLLRLSGAPLVAPTPEATLRLLIAKAFEKAEIELNVVADIDSLSSMLAIAERGRACAILPASAILARPSQNLPIRRIVDPEITRPVSLCWSTTLPRSAASQAVCKLVVDLIAELHRSEEWSGIVWRP